MAKKQKDVEELLVEKNREIDALLARVKELEAEVNRYHEMEQSIVRSMTMAAQTKEVSEKEAQQKANAIIANARKQAQAKIAETEKTTTAALTSAREEAARMLDAARKKSTAELNIAHSEAERIKAEYTKINDVIMTAAETLDGYIADFRDIFNTETGRLTESSDKVASELPDEYDNPEDLYHAVMQIEGRAVSPVVTDDDDADTEENDDAKTAASVTDDETAQESSDSDEEVSMPVFTDVPEDALLSSEQKAEMSAIKGEEKPAEDKDASEQKAEGKTPAHEMTEEEELRAILKDVFGSDLD